MSESLSIRIDNDNPDHHLWNNHGTWWIHYTVHTDDWRVKRVRRSLGTRCRETARLRRDALLRELAFADARAKAHESHPHKSRGVMHSAGDEKDERRDDRQRPQGDSSPFAVA